MLPDLKSMLTKEEKALATAQDEHNRRLAYRLLLGISQRSGTGTIALTADTPEEIWDSDYIKNYFNFYQINPDRYKRDFLHTLGIKGYYHLSNLYGIFYCRLSKSGRALIETPETPKNEQE